MANGQVNLNQQSDSAVLATLDLPALAELQALLEDDFEALIRDYLQDAVSSKAAINQACRQLEHDQLRHAVHSQKGSALNIGAPKLAELWAVVEQQAANRLQNRQLIASAISQAEAQLQTVHQALEMVLADPNLLQL